MNLNISPALARDAARALRNHAYEQTDAGIFIPGAGAFVGGAFRSAYCPAGGEFEPWQIDPNKVTAEGLTYILGTALAKVAQITAFYLAPYSGNVEPQDSWTGVTWAAAATEFEGYSSATRLPWTTATPTAASVGNSASVSDSTLTLTAAGNLYGVALVSSNVKSGTTGKCVAASSFATARTNMAIGDKLAMEYVISATDEG